MNRIVTLVVVAASVAHGNAPAPLHLNDPAPEPGIERLLQAPAGAEATLEALRGSVVVLDFWATWCAPCVASFPHMLELEKQFAGRPVRFISVTDESAAAVEKMLRKREIPGWIGLDRSLFKADGEALGVIERV